MSMRQLLVLMTIAFVLFLQFAVPAIQLPEEGANRWGWQMYSRENPNPDIVAVMADGERSEVNLSDHLSHRRAEIRVDDLMLRQLCERIADAEHFELTYEEPEEVVIYQCIE